MLCVDDVRFRHEGTEFHYELYVPKGSITALIGPSGGGKSTLLDLIAGFLDPTSGRITIDGQDVTSVPPALRPVTSLFQDHNLFGHFDVFTNVALGIRPNARLSASERSMVNDSLARLGIGALGSRRPYELSGGERQRAALARCLVRKRPLLLLDEPFAALGPAMRRDFLDLVDELRREEALTVVLVTHQPEDAARIADRLAVLAGGTIIAVGPRAEIMANPPAILAEYLG
ncbi:MAG TPA: ATP-binding cassette domain-containing protein [Geminicoccus sp.]|uniref:thiamine ABC transporter ATP-binding protein n=1 Tax=Geminicoccus sp. TaxID=2024832 RepID=UPI002E3004F9|nr:ATP-binding cassette domain-containing protein [Geminicoccus sp.]HEX2529276.1 ATP-binding cassette domain-containing protein [Geminicoccus sp.]